MENACHRSVQNFYPSVRLIFKDLKINTHKTLILPTAPRAQAMQSFALSEESRIRYVEKRVVRRIFGHKREKVTTGRRKLHSEKL
jgi:hypothetical protein